MRSWFLTDDFAWLGLRLHIHSAADFFDLLFAPKAQGTIRPWSERLYFTGFQMLFGLDALPFRIWAFFTQLVNLALLGAIARRITGSMLAGVAVPLFWAVNASLAEPLSWTARYNQVLCATFLLGAFYCFVRLTESGDRRWLAATWVIFLLGFGALEMNVVFPALAAGYALLGEWGRAAPCSGPPVRPSQTASEATAARGATPLLSQHLLATLPMFAVSGLYVLVHRAVSPRIASGPYAMHFDAAILTTLATYWENSFGGARLALMPVDGRLQALGQIAPLVLTIALAAFLAAGLWGRAWLRLFPLLWFLALIAPVLPLRDHISDYYLATATIGLALLGGWAFAAAWSGGLAARVVALLMAALYLGTSAPVGHAIAEYSRQRSQAVRRMVQGVVHARQLHPGRTILLHGVSSDLYWAAVNDNPFRVYGVQDVFLTPGSEGNIEAHPELGDPGEFVLPAAQTLSLFARRKAVVYSAAGVDQGGRLTNITTLYGALARGQLKPAASRRVDAGHPAFADQLGEGWYPAEGGYRWMPRRAVVWLGGPRSAEERLHIRGYCPAEHMAKGPVRMTVWVDGTRLGEVEIDQAGTEFRYEFALPLEAVGRERLEVVVETDRTVVPAGETRELGLAFGVLRVR